MQPRICQCCGETMKAAGLSNPNVCLGCDQWSFDSGGSGIEAQVYAEESVNVPAEHHAQSPEQAGRKVA